MLVDRLMFLFVLIIYGASYTYSFTIPSDATGFSSAQKRQLATSLQAEQLGNENNIMDSFVEDLKTKVRIIQKARADSASFKQIVADVLAGEYDSAKTREELEELVASAPCVVFTWEASPFSQKALKYLDIAGADIKNIKLDEPWDKGNILRAELGKWTGKTSVPSVWIGGEYVGGFDEGVNEEKPGILELAFKGELVPKLDAAGALKK
uniref:Glutaredoxin domain-containing protein n=1 Tax=Helicotheca tamesis TaxID=374047 RepID=A0A7S2GQY4_9STRA|mmetsp:Transcript_11021/g.15294  ORF Transcript_11021/g.15294 Transcript_11021/m.15294 type:complete len:209 (+) Transcript_11021:117-743(+)|eukprot:CAMPEP_0185728504 /NCGR_PEP_ID=MMETSP1171-20130828/3818_1 /TAXON_ID=374046 /ORGANISM="Helicotheca tamensis, Strain CCMP826" /LENGTH=208 /DNA_ID=CAMNT_0028397219 /DNA_START=92 /DNA_END=718 /DNA_ORIENTATION=-